MRIFKDMELVEQLGSGVPRILQFYGKDCFKFSDNFIRMSFPMEQVTEKVINLNEGVNEGVDGLLKLIDELPGRRKPFYAEKLNTPEKTVERWIKQLREKNKIEFRGAPKTGGYFVSENNKKQNKNK